VSANKLFLPTVAVYIVLILQCKKSQNVIGSRYDNSDISEIYITPLALNNNPSLTQLVIEGCSIIEESNPQSTTLRASMLTITPLMRHLQTINHF
jgi:hypothetical protein